MGCVFCESEGCRICGHSGWIEVLGCGMVHTEVFRQVGIVNELFTGYAFGLGIERTSKETREAPDHHFLRPYNTGTTQS